METLTSSNFYWGKQITQTDFSKLFRQGLPLGKAGLYCRWGFALDPFCLHPMSLLSCTENSVPVQRDPFPNRRVLGSYCSLTKGSDLPKSGSTSLSARERISTCCPSQPLSQISISRLFQAQENLAGLLGSNLSLLEIPEAHSLHNAN